MDLRALAGFVLVADSGGFAAAGRRSGQSKATLSRHVRELEADLGTRLFDRDTRALRLTEPGKLLCARARGPLGELSEAERALRAASDKPRGLLRVGAPILFSAVALGAIAASYRRKNPAVQIQVVSDDRMASAVEDGLDIVIRVNPKPNDMLVGRCFLKERYQFVAAPALVELAAGDMAHVWPSVVVGANSGTFWLAAEGDAERRIAHEPVLRTSLILTAYHAALAGAGAARLPAFLVADDVAAGRLARLGEDPRSAVEIWALHPSRRLASPKVTSFLEHLANTFPNDRWPADPRFARLG